MTTRKTKSSSSQGDKMTTQQQRHVRRVEKLEEFRRAEARTKRNRLIGLIAGGAAAVIVLASLVVYVTTSSTAKNSSAETIKGVQTYTGLPSNHVSGPVAYKQTPPAGGDHSEVVLNCAVYTKPVPNENAVHSLEHGAVWVTYDPATVGGDQLATLRNDIPSTYAILSPYSGLPSPIVVSAWGAQLKVTRADDPRIGEFMAKYRESPSAPEPGAACSGGIDAPGKVSR